MNAIEIIKRACQRLGIPAPSIAIGNENTQIVQMLGLLNEEGQELAAEYAWQKTTFEGSFTTVATESQGVIDGGIVPAGMRYRYILNDTLQNRSSLMPIYGPKAPTAWQQQKALNLTGPWPQYRIRGGELIMDPVPTAGDNVYFEYVSKNWATSSDGLTGKCEITSDEDIFRIEDELLLLGVQWRWQAAKGLDYAQKFDSYSRRVQDAKARDKTAAVLSLDGNSARNAAGIVVPIGNYTL